jgi:L-asparaginase/Glu-tRNA(Gln) amidotransferase subunit D
LLLGSILYKEKWWRREVVKAIFAGDLSGVKARILLMVLLVDPHARLQLREVIAEMAP